MQHYSTKSGDNISGFLQKQVIIVSGGTYCRCNLRKLFPKRQSRLLKNGTPFLGTHRFSSPFNAQHNRNIGRTWRSISQLSFPGCKISICGWMTGLLGSVIAVELIWKSLWKTDHHLLAEAQPGVLIGEDKNKIFLFVC